MNISFLKECINSNIPLYIEKLQVNIVDIYEEFNLIEIQDTDGFQFMVDISVVSLNPYREKSISLKRII
ncbi:MAG TPA: hypothetical protein PKA28_17590 [Methylomusa anaerophila]|uniref:Uncharacterized protein n=1 Tax=Methylomusa anaerophila TaxID=1930071 RepID=A0A348AMI4_9FIRM|nr:hypothetical protein [Methylomusa anaerophila]BBB92282.1 hypothetical protein MAMMFC1_02967 [Methylomusa anaerophila]HML90257.1 hypothetical protein [Methylomusa anaerophila]